jgi:hypothetical protein
MIGCLRDLVKSLPCNYQEVASKAEQVIRYLLSLQRISMAFVYERVSHDRVCSRRVLMLKGAQAYNVWLSFTNIRDSTLVTTIGGTSHVPLLWGCCVQSPTVG